MKSDVKRWLRFADRALRPKAAAVRVLASETAASNSLIRDLAAQLEATTRELRTGFPTGAGAAPGSTAGPAAVPTEQAAAAESAAAAPQVPVVAEGPVGDPDGIPDNGQYDAWTAQVIAKVLAADPGTGVDVGAHHGDILTSIIAAAPDQHHYAFEPIPAMAANLRERFPDVAVHQVALAAEPGATQFNHVVSNPGYSGILQRRYDRPDEEIQLIDVELRRLDDLVDPDDPVRLLKIDVEGAELGVLQGAARTLGRWHPVVVFEFGLGASDVYGTTPRHIHDEFARHGMSVTLLNRWLTGAEPLTYEEFEQQYATGRNYYFLAYLP